MIQGYVLLPGEAPQYIGKHKKEIASGYAWYVGNNSIGIMPLDQRVDNDFCCRFLYDSNNDIWVSRRTNCLGIFRESDHSKNITLREDDGKQAASLIEKLIELLLLEDICAFYAGAKRGQSCFDNERILTFRKRPPNSDFYSKEKTIEVIEHI